MINIILTDAEKEFLKSNYYNYTAKQLTLSLNKMRKRLGEKILKQYDIAQYLCEIFAVKKDEVKTVAPALPPRVRGRNATSGANKTKALREIASENQADALSISLQELGYDEEIG